MVEKKRYLGRGEIQVQLRSLESFAPSPSTMIDDVLLPKLVNNAQSVQMKMGYSDEQPGFYA